LWDVFPGYHAFVFLRDAVNVRRLDVRAAVESNISLGVFNSALMNDAVYKFKRYEDASLSYAGVSKHADREVGLYDTVISSKEFGAPFVNQPLK